MDQEWEFVELRDQGLKRLKLQLQALAQPAKVQIALLPKHCYPADELANDFDSWFCWFRAHHNEPWFRLYREQCDDSAALPLLEQIDTLLESMSGRERYWTAAALHHEQSWERIRELARLALGQFGWPAEPPAEPI